MLPKFETGICKDLEWLRMVTNGYTDFTPNHDSTARPVGVLVLGAVLGGGDFRDRSVGWVALRRPYPPYGIWGAPRVGPVGLSAPPIAPKCQPEFTF